MSTKLICVGHPCPLLTGQPCPEWTGQPCPEWTGQPCPEWSGQIDLNEASLASSYTPDTWADNTHLAY